MLTQTRGSRAMPGGVMSSLPPSQRGSEGAMTMPMAVTAKLNMRHAVMACRSTLRAAASSLAPTLWAACTENPVVTAEQMPQKSQRLVDTSPIAAESSAPSRPTIDASIYCMRMLDNCASIAGSDSITVSFSCWPKLIGHLLLFAIYRPWG